MAIIVKERDKKALRVNKTPLIGDKQEDFLQATITGNPEMVPFDELKENIRPLIIGREFDDINVFGIDQDGDIYIIETKLFKNPDKRIVVAQALDYGASLWSRYGKGAHEAINEFWNKAEQRIRELYEVELDEKLGELVATEDERGEVSEGAEGEDRQTKIEDLRSAVEKNLSDGKFTFLVLMDRLPDGVKTHIDYLNENSKFWVLGVELEYYEHGDLQIVVPTMYGNESSEKSSQARNRASGTVWDDEKFLAVLAEHVPPEVAQVGQDLLKWSRAEFGLIRWTATGSFKPWLVYPGKNKRLTPFLVHTDGAVQVYFGDMMTEPPFSNIELRKELRGRLEKISGLTINDTKLGAYPGFRIGSLLEPEAMKTFKDTMLWWKKELVKTQ